MKRSGDGHRATWEREEELPRFLSWLEKNDIRFDEIGIRTAGRFQKELIESRTKQGRLLSVRTVHSYLTAAGSFCDYLKGKKIIATNPFKEMKKVRVDYKVPKHIPKEKQLNAFLDRLSQFDRPESTCRKIMAYRLHVIAELMYSTGLRASEVAELKTSDINLSRSLVTVRQGKGGEPRTAYLNDYAKEVLRIYLDSMRPLVFSARNRANGSLFGVGFHSFDKMVNKALAGPAKASGLEHFTSHMFRHSLGYHLHRAGCNIRHIQSILGHKRLRNTEIYVAVDKESLRDVLDTYHPRSSIHHDQAD